MHRRLFFALLLVALMALVPVGLALAQGGDPPLVPNTGDGIPEDAVLVDVQRLDSCDEDSKPEDLCYFELYQAGPQGQGAKLGVGETRSTAWYICSIRAYNWLDRHVGTLTNYTQAEKGENPPGYKKWKLITENNTTWAYFGYYWDNVSGPTPDPGWGTWEYDASTRSDGRLNLWPQYKWFYVGPSFHTDHRWNCFGGSYY